MGAAGAHLSITASGLPLRNAAECGSAARHGAIRPARDLAAPAGISGKAAVPRRRASWID